MHQDLRAQVVGVMGFLELALQRRQCEMLAVQMLNELGLLLDDIIKDSAMEGEKYKETKRLSVAPMDSEDAVLGHATYMQAYLSAYVKASKENTGEETCFSVATDKGRVHGLNLMMTALVKPDNSASWMPPQAAHPVHFVAYSSSPGGSVQGYQNQPRGLFSALRRALDFSTVPHFVGPRGLLVVETGLFFLWSPTLFGPRVSAWLSAPQARCQEGPKRA